METLMRLMLMMRGPGWAPSARSGMELLSKCDWHDAANADDVLLGGRLQRLLL